MGKPALSVAGGNSVNSVAAVTAIATKVYILSSK
jgi:hypothetical protein